MFLNSSILYIFLHIVTIPSSLSVQFLLGIIFFSPSLLWCTPATNNFGGFLMFGNVFIFSLLLVLSYLIMIFLYLSLHFLWVLNAEILRSKGSWFLIKFGILSILFPLVFLSHLLLYLLKICVCV